MLIDARNVNGLFGITRNLKKSDNSVNSISVFILASIRKVFCFMEKEYNSVKSFLLVSFR